MYIGSSQIMEKAKISFDVDFNIDNIKKYTLSKKMILRSINYHCR